MIPWTRYGRPARRTESSPFATTEPWRPLKLVLDDESLGPDDVALLTNFVSYPELELWRTAPDAYPRFEIDEPFDTTPLAIGGAVSILTRAEGGGAGVFGVYGLNRLRERADQIAAEHGIAATAALRALTFAAASDEVDADAFVSRRHFLATDREGSRDPIVVSPEEAMALIGLVLRARGNHSIGADLMDFRLEGSSFYFLLARDLLHSGWRWFSGCVMAGHAASDDSIV